ncbi:MAG: ribonuclease H-like domain-containing protein [Anaerolineae bacterium]|nr:ribonuclease H-like domain-containing protein [Anaerolineae bacterium]
MEADLRERLRRLGVHKGIAQLKPARSPLPPAHFTDDLTPLETPLGFAYVRSRRFPLDYAHGKHRIGDILHLPKVTLALFGTRHTSEMTLALDEALFLDIETSGLTGAGNLAFLVGVAYTEGDQLVLEQFFLRNPAEEAALLFALAQRLSMRPALFTFNGAAFDVPLLETRFLRARLSATLSEHVHVDLLLPARRLWRRVLGACHLGALEYHVLGVQRSQLDVYSAIIPQLYREFLLFGNGVLNEDMRRVLYHNEQDVLSLVVLAGHIAETLLNPSDAPAHLALGQHHEQRGEHDRACQHYQAAAQRADRPTLKSEALRRLARQLKRRGEHDAAFHYWQQLAALDDLEGIIEAAKYLEWRKGDVAAALLLARKGLALAVTRAQRAALRQRVSRLSKKVLLKRRAVQQAAQGAHRQ